MPDAAKLSSSRHARKDVRIRKSRRDLEDLLMNPTFTEQVDKTRLLLSHMGLSSSFLKATICASISMDKGGDVFGLIYEYFLGKFAMSEGQKGGEFYTPTSMVKLIVEILEPYHGRILDPACGSGGMFVQSARFVQEHQKNPTAEISVYGQEKTSATAKLARPSRPARR